MVPSSNLPQNGQWFSLTLQERDVEEQAQKVAKKMYCFIAPITLLAFLLRWNAVADHDDEHRLSWVCLWTAWILMHCIALAAGCRFVCTTDLCVGRHCLYFVYFMYAGVAPVVYAGHDLLTGSTVLVVGCRRAVNVLIFGAAQYVLFGRVSKRLLALCLPGYSLYFGGVVWFYLNRPIAGDCSMTGRPSLLVAQFMSTPVLVLLSRPLLKSMRQRSELPIRIRPSLEEDSTVQGDRGASECARPFGNVISIGKSCRNCSKDNDKSPHCITSSCNVVPSANVADTECNVGGESGRKADDALQSKRKMEMSRLDEVLGANQPKKSKEQFSSTAWVQSVERTAVPVESVEDSISVGVRSLASHLLLAGWAASSEPKNTPGIGVIEHIDRCFGEGDGQRVETAFEVQTSTMDDDGLSSTDAAVQAPPQINGGEDTTSWDELSFLGSDCHSLTVSDCTQNLVCVDVEPQTDHSLVNVEVQTTFTWNGCILTCSGCARPPRSRKHTFDGAWQLCPVPRGAPVEMRFLVINGSGCVDSSEVCHTIQEANGVYFLEDWGNVILTMLNNGMLQLRSQRTGVSATFVRAQQGIYNPHAVGEISNVSNDVQNEATMQEHRGFKEESVQTESCLVQYCTCERGLVTEFDGIWFRSRHHGKSIKSLRSLRVSGSTVIDWCGQRHRCYTVGNSMPLGDGCLQLLSETSMRYESHECRIFYIKVTNDERLVEDGLSEDGLPDVPDDESVGASDDGDDDCSDW